MKIYNLLFLLTICLPISAQANSFISNQSYGLQGNYVQINTSNKGKTESVINGDFFLIKEKGICWFTKDPIEMMTVMKPETVYTVTKTEKRELGSSENPVFAQVALLIQALFNYDKNLLDTYLKEERNEKEIVFLPKDTMTQQILNQIKIKLNEEDTIKEVSIEYSKGQSTDYILSNVEYLDELLAPYDKELCFE